MNKLRLSACAMLPLIAFSATAQEGEYYTQRNLWIYKDESSTVNYAVDLMVPVNSRVTIEREKRKEVQLTLVDSGVSFSIVWDDEYTNRSLDELKGVMLGAAPVDLSQFSEAAQSAIKAGQVRPGMTREEVLVARGYPPSHATLSLDSDQWRYWQNRWNTILVQFEDGKVATVID